MYKSVKCLVFALALSVSVTAVAEPILRYNFLGSGLLIHDDGEVKATIYLKFLSSISKRGEICTFNWEHISSEYKCSDEEYRYFIKEWFKWKNKSESPR